MERCHSLGQSPKTRICNGLLCRFASEDGRGSRSQRRRILRSYYTCVAVLANNQYRQEKLMSPFRTPHRRQHAPGSAVTMRNIGESRRDKVRTILQRTRCRNRAMQKHTYEWMGERGPQHVHLCHCLFPSLTLVLHKSNHRISVGALRAKCARSAEVPSSVASCKRLWYDIPRPVWCATGSATSDVHRSGGRD